MPRHCASLDNKQTISSENASLIVELTHLPLVPHMWIGSALVQIMVRRLFGTEPLSEPRLGYCQLIPRNKLQWNFNQNSIFFIQENTFENVVCEMAAILSRRRHVESLFWFDLSFYLHAGCDGVRNMSAPNVFSCCLWSLAERSRQHTGIIVVSIKLP